MSSERAPGRASAWQRWRALPGSERRLVLELFFLLPAVAVAIRLFGIRRVCAFLLRPSAPPVAAPATGDDARTRTGEDARTRTRTGEDACPTRIAHLVDAAARRIPGRPACLTRSVTLCCLLRRRGLPATLRVGVRKSEGRLEAHAWVELDGVVVNDRDDVARQFPPFERLNLDTQSPETL